MNVKKICLIYKWIVRETSQSSYMNRTGATLYFIRCVFIVFLLTLMLEKTSLTGLFMVLMAQVILKLRLRILDLDRVLKKISQMPHSNHKSEERPLDPNFKTKLRETKLLSFSSSESSPSKLISKILWIRLT